MLKCTLGDIDSALGKDDSSFNGCNHDKDDGNTGIIEAGAMDDEIALGFCDNFSDELC